jgi:hypothetical protein
MKKRLMELYKNGGWVRYDKSNGLPLAASNSDKKNPLKDSVWVDDAEMIADAMMLPGNFRVKDGALMRQGG